jgi:hypothetical protein
MSTNNKSARDVIRDAREKSASAKAPPRDESQTRAVIREAREAAAAADTAAAQAASAAAAPPNDAAKGAATDGRVRVEKAKSRP